MEVVEKHMVDVHVRRAVVDGRTIVQHAKDELLNPVVRHCIDSHSTPGSYELESFSDLAGGLLRAYFSTQGEPNPFSIQVRGLRRYMGRKTIRSEADQMRERLIQRVCNADCVHLMADGRSAHDNSYVGALGVLPSGRRVLLDLRAFERGESAGADEAAAIFDDVLRRHGLLDRPRPFRFTAFTADSCIANRATLRTVEYLQRGQPFSAPLIFCIGRGWRPSTLFRRSAQWSTSCATPASFCVAATRSLRMFWLSAMTLSAGDNGGLVVKPRKAWRI
jgi:hypothetical protein